MKLDISDYNQSEYDYKEYWRNRQYEDEAERMALRKLLPQRGENVIDIGGGYGRLSSLYTNCFKKAVLFDYSQENLKRASDLPNLEKVQGSVYEMPFPDNFFDTSLMVRLLHHLHQPQKALAEINRILKPQGILILEFPNKLHLKNRLKALALGNPGYLSDLRPLDLASRTTKSGIFYNYHPQYIRQMLGKTGFEISAKVEVSALRWSLLKKWLPLRVLLTLEQQVQLVSNLFPFQNHFYFTPSVFLKCYKKASR